MESIADFQPLRQSQHLNVSTNPWPTNQTFSTNMQTKEALSKIDKLVIDYLALTNDDKQASAIKETAAEYKAKLSNLTEDKIDFELTRLRKSLDTIVDGIDESVDSRSAKAVEVAFKSMWALSSLSASQSQMLKQACEEIDKHGSVSNATANKLLLLIGRPQNDNNLATMLAVVEDAYDNPDAILVDEAIALQNQLSYLGNVIDESVARLPECLAHLSASVTGQSKTAQEIVNDLHAICKRQTSSSALIASQYVETLKQHLNDWTLAMKYGAVHGVPNGKSVVQATLLAQSEKYETFMTSLQSLLKDIAKAFGCVTSMDTVKTELGYEMLRVKLIQNWGQAEHQVYASIASILMSLGIECQVRVVNSVALYLFINIDKNRIVASNQIVDAEHSKMQCIEMLLKAFGHFAINANKMTELYNIYILPNSFNWWNACSNCRKAIQESGKELFAAYWSTIDLQEQLACLTLLNNPDAKMFASSVLGSNISWIDVPEVCKTQFAEMLRNNFNA